MDLKAYRTEIDKVDDELLKLFEKRMELCGDIARLKIKTGRPVLDRERELEKIDQMTGQAHTEFNEHSARELFSQIMTLSRKLQYNVMAEKGTIGSIPFEMVPIIPKNSTKVVYQGTEGAYSHAALKQFFGENTQNYNVKTFDDAMKAICGGMADYAVLPIDNSMAGQVSNVYDLLMHYDNYIVGETYLKVEHVLLGLPDATLDDVKVVYSHPQGLMQCADFLDEQKNWLQRPADNTALSARQVMLDGDKTHVAIASENAGSLYGLKVLKRNLTFSENNTTRFIIVSSKKIYAENAGKVSICFSTSHDAGALYSVLSHLTYNNLNMSKIESRPIPGKAWEYRFFVDFEGNLSNPEVKNAVRGILEEAVYFKILGNY